MEFDNRQYIVITEYFEPVLVGGILNVSVYDKNRATTYRNAIFDEDNDCVTGIFKYGDLLLGTFCRIQRIKEKDDKSIINLKSLEKVVIKEYVSKKRLF